MRPHSSAVGGCGAAPVGLPGGGGSARLGARVTRARAAWIACRGASLVAAASILFGAAGPAAGECAHGLDILNYTAAPARVETTTWIGGGAAVTGGASHPVPAVRA